MLILGDDAYCKQILSHVTKAKRTRTLEPGEEKYRFLERIPDFKSLVTKGHKKIENVFLAKAVLPLVIIRSVQCSSVL